MVICLKCDLVISANSWQCFKCIPFVKKHDNKMFNTHFKVINICPILIQSIAAGGHLLTISTLRQSCHSKYKIHTWYISVSPNRQPYIAEYMYMYIFKWDTLEDYISFCYTQWRVKDLNILVGIHEKSKYKTCIKITAWCKCEVNLALHNTIVEDMKTTEGVRSSKLGWGMQLPQGECPLPVC